MSLDLRRSDDRFVTRTEGRTTRHSFSFGSHYDPARLGFAAMVAHNDEVLPPGTGYPDHPHSGIEIVTWVLSGALRHSETDGTAGVLLPGDVQRISAGSGIVHAEVSDPELGSGVETRFLQTWLRPDRAGGVPAYGVERGHREDGLVEVVGPGGLDVRTAGARLLLGTPSGTVRLPDDPQLHVFAVSGRFGLGALELGPGDTALLVDEDDRTLRVIEPGPIAVWAFGV